MVLGKREPQEKEHQDSGDMLSGDMLSGDKPANCIQMHQGILRSKEICWRDYNSLS